MSEKRDMDAAKQFFKQAIAVVGHAPEHVTTHGHRSYPRAISETMGNDVQHRTNTYLNNRLEQDHRFIKRLARQEWAFSPLKRHGERFKDMR